jgi:hypothetical protein
MFFVQGTSTRLARAASTSRKQQKGRHTPVQVGYDAWNLLLAALAVMDSTTAWQQHGGMTGGVLASASLGCTPLPAPASRLWCSSSAKAGPPAQTFQRRWRLPLQRTSPPPQRPWPAKVRRLGAWVDWLRFRHHGLVILAPGVRVSRWRHGCLSPQGNRITPAPLQLAAWAMSCWGAGRTAVPRVSVPHHGASCLCTAPAPRVSVPNARSALQSEDLQGV